MSNSTNTTTDGDPWMLTSLDIISSVLSIVGFPTNAIIIYLVSKHRNLKNATNYFVSSLAIADLIVLICMLFWNYGKEMMYRYAEYRFLFPSIDVYTGTLSMLNVACVSADRAIAVSWPLQYERVVTTKRALFVIFSIWAYSLVILILGLIRKNITNHTYQKCVLYLGYGNFFVAALVTLLCYIVIFLIVFPKLKASRKLEKLMSYSRFTFSQGAEQELNGNKKKNPRLLLREIKVTGNVLLIVVPFTIGWTFFIGTHFYEEFNPPLRNQMHNLVMIIFPWILSGLNPIIYLLVNRSLRQTFCESLRKLFKRHFKANNYFLSDSRRASSARTSSTLCEGSELINLHLRNLRKSDSISARSSASMDKSTEEVPLSNSPQEVSFSGCCI